MNEAPKKIWKERSHKVYTENADFVIETQKFEPTQYIRADLVDGLVEGLEMCVKHLDADGNLWSKEEQTMALAALKALEDPDV